MDTPSSRWTRLAWSALACATALVLGCEPSGVTLDVDVQTGIVPGREFGYVSVEVAPGLVPRGTMPSGSHLAGQAIEVGDLRFERGARVAELRGLEPGLYTLRAVLRRPALPGVARDAGAILIENWLTVPVTRDRVQRIRLTADCIAVECPAPAGSAAFSACLNGRCVDPRCDPGDPSTFTPYCCDATVDDCARSAVCAVDDDCRAVAACLDVACVEGACIESASDHCPSGTYCSRVSGACEAAAMPDAGLVDGGALDAPSPDDAATCVACPFDCVDGVCRGPEWSLALGTGRGNAIASLGTDLVVVGRFGGALTFAPCPTLSAMGGTDLFVVRLDDGGRCVWARGFGSASDDEARGVATDGTDRVFVTGAVGGSVDFGGGAQPSRGGDDVFVLSLAAADGAHVWSTLVGSPGNSEGGAAVAFDGGPTDAEVVVVASEGGGLGGLDFAIRRFRASDGSPDAPIFFGGPSADEAAALLVVPGASGERGDLIVAGAVTGVADLNGALPGGAIMPVGESDAFVARFDGTGALTWSTPLSGPRRDDLFSIALSSAGLVLAGGATVEASGVDPNGVVLALDSSTGVPRWATGFGTDTTLAMMADGAAAVAVDARGLVHVAGLASGSWTFVGSAVGVDGGACPLGCENPMLAHVASDGTPLSALQRPAMLSGLDFFRALVTDGDRDFLTGELEQHVYVEAIRQRP